MTNIVDDNNNVPICIALSAIARLRASFYSCVQSNYSSKASMENLSDIILSGKIGGDSQFYEALDTFVTMCTIAIENLYWIMSSP